MIGVSQTAHKHGEEHVRREDRVVLTAAAMSDLILSVTLPLVLVVAHTILRQRVQDVGLVLVGLSVDPRLEVGAHLPLHRRRIVVEVGVMETLEDLVGDVVRIDGSVFPRLHDGLDGVLDDDGSDLASGLIQDEDEAAKGREVEIRHPSRDRL